MSKSLLILLPPVGTPSNYLLCKIRLATHESKNKTIPSLNRLQIRGLRGVRLNTFWGNHLKLYMQFQSWSKLSCALCTEYVLLNFLTCYEWRAKIYYIIYYFIGMCKYSLEKSKCTNTVCGTGVCRILYIKK